MVEMTAFGAALAAGFAVKIWSMRTVKSACDTFAPTISQDGECLITPYIAVY